MDKDTAQTIVKVYAILAWISAFIWLAAALGVAFWGSTIRGMMGSYNMMGNNYIGNTVSSAIGIVLLIIAIFYVFVGIGLWNKRPWARVATLVFSVLSLFSFPIGTAIGVFGIWLFGFEPTVIGLFGGRSITNITVSVKTAKRKKK